MNSLSKILVSIVATLLLWGCGSPVSANPDTIRGELAKRFPDLKTERVTLTQYGNLFEVFTGTEIFYTDAKATFLVLGTIMELPGRNNITEARLSKLTAIKFDELPLENAIKIVRGDGSRRIAIFEDPLCGYCKRFEADLAKVDNITAYMFLYPILGPASTVKSRAIWCSADRVLAWQDWMLRDKVPTAAADSCQAPMAPNVALGQRLRVNGTPATFFEDGERIAGAIPRETIESKLASLVKPVSAVTPTAKQ